MALTAAELEIVLKARDEASKTLDAVKGKARDLGPTFSQVGSSLTGVGKNLTAGVTLPLVGIGTAAAKVAGDFEQQMNILTVAARSSGTSLDDLSKAALNVGADTELVGITAAQSADAMTSLYKAGFDTAQIFGGPGGLNSYLNEGASLTGALRSAIDLAAASELDLAAATDATIIAMKTFGLSSEDASRVANSFVRTADASVASVGDLVAAMANVGPTAAAFGWSLETTNTALGILSSRGIAGAEAGTALKSMMTNLMRPTDAVTGALKGLNVSLYDSQGRLKDLPVIMGELEKALTVTEGAVGGLTEQQRLETIQTIAGTYGMKAMNTLLAEGSAGWEGMEAAIAGAASVEESAGARTEGFNAALEQMGGALETIAIKAGGPLITSLTRLIQGPISGLLDKISNLSPAVWDWAVKIGLVVAAVGPLLLVLGTLLSSVGSAIAVVTTLAPLFGIVGVAIGALAAPLLLVIGATGSVSKAFETMGRAFRGLRGLFQGKYEGYKDLADALGSLGLGAGPIKAVMDVLLRLRDAAGQAWATLQKLPFVFQAIAGAIAFLISGEYEGGLKKFIDGLYGLGVSAAGLGPAVDVLKKVRDVIAAVVTVFASGLMGDTIESMAMLGPLWKGLHVPPGIAEALNDIVFSIGRFARGIGEAVALIGQGDFVGAFAKVFESIRGLAGGILDALKSVDWVSIWNTAKAAAISAASAVWSNITDLAAKVWTGIKAGFESIKNLVGGIDWAGIWNAIKTAAVTVATSVWSVVSDVAPKVLAWLKSGIEAAKGLLAGIDFAGIWESVKTAIVNAAASVSAAAQPIGAAIAKWFDDARGRAQELITGMDMTGIADATRGRMTAAMAAQKIEDIGRAISNWLINASKWVSNNLAPAIESFAATLTKMAESVGKQEAGKGESSPIAQAIGKAFVAILKAAWGLLTNKDLWVALWHVVVAQITLTESIKKQIADKMLEVGYGIVEGIVKGIENKVGVMVAGVEKFVNKIPEVAKKLLGIASPSKVMIEIGENITGGLTIGIEGGGGEAVAAMQKVVSGIAKAWKDLASAFHQMNKVEKTEGGLPNLALWAAALKESIIRFSTAIADATREVKDKTIRRAEEFASKIEKIFELLKTFGSTLAALKDTQIIPDIAPFARALYDMIVTFTRAINQAVTELGDKAVKSAAQMAEHAAKIIALIGPAVQALGSMADMQEVTDLDSKTAQLSAAINTFLNHLNGLALRWANTGLEAAVTFSEAATKVVGLIGPAVQALAAFVDFPEVQGLEGKAQQLIDGLQVFLDKLNWLALVWGNTSLDSAVKFSEAAAKVVGFIKPAVDALAALGTYVSSKNLYAAADSLKTDLWILMKKISNIVADIGTIKADAIKFSEDVVKAISFIKSAVETLTALGGYVSSANLYTAADNLKTDLWILLKKISNIVADIGTIKEEFITFSEAVVRAIGFIKPGIEALAALGEYVSNANLYTAADSLKTDLWILLKKISNIVADIGTISDEAIAFSEGVAKAVGFIKPAIEALSALGGYVSSGRLYDGADSLKTDLWILLKKLSSIVADVGTISEETIAFSEGVVKAVGFIKPGIEALVALGDYKGVKALFSKLQDFVSDLDLALSWIREIAKLWVADDLIAIGEFSTNIQGTVGFIKPAVDAIEALAKYTAAKGLTGAMVKFETDLKAVVTKLGEIATKLAGEDGIGKANAFATAATAIKNAIDTGLGALSGITGGGAGGAAAALQAFAVAAKQGMADAVTAVQAGVKAIKEALLPLPSWIFAWFATYKWSSIGKAIGQGIANGITASIPAIKNAAVAAAKAALTAAKQYLGVASPSKKARAEVGQMFGRGLALGITDTLGRIRNAMAEMTAAMTIRPQFAYAGTGARATAQPAATTIGGGTYNLTYVDQRPGGGAPDLLSVAERLEWRARMRR